MASKSTCLVQPVMDKKDQEEKQYKWNIVWFNVILMGLLNLGGICGYFIRWDSMLYTKIYAKVTLYMATYGVTAGAHRLWSHKTYEANALLQIILAMCMTLTYQNSILVWCRDHRLHHKFSETDADPHNAKRGFFFSHVGWLLVRKHPEVIEKGKLIDVSDLTENSIVMFQHKYYYILVFFGAFILPIFIPVYLWGESLKLSFFSTLTRLVLQLNVTWCINSLAHLYGFKPYNKSIGPTENPFMKIFGCGEGFHNYHHTYPSDYRASEYGMDTRNSTTLFIDIFAKLGWATDRKITPPHTIRSRMEITGDGSTDRDKENSVLSRCKSWLLLLVFVSVM